MPDEQPKDQAPQTPPKEESQAMVLATPTPMREMLAVLKDTGDAELFRAFAHDIIEREVAAARFGQDAQLARVFAGSGAFDGINGTNQGVSLAMTKIQLGRSWNMAAGDAMENIHFINGRPSVATRYLAAKMQDAGVSWDIEWDEDDKGTCTGCHLHLKRWNADTKKYDPIMGRVNGKEQQAVVSFTKKDADGAMIHEGGKQIRLSDKWNFKSWPSDMYFARCVSRVRVRYAANILSGILTREEAEDSGNDAPPPGTSHGAERAALASATKLDEIGKKLEAAKPKPEPAAPVQPTVSSGASPVSDDAATQAAAPPAAAPPPAASNVVSISPDKAPWAAVTGKERPTMVKLYSEIAQAVGKPAFEEIMAKYGFEWSQIPKTPWDSPKVLECYREMEARAKAPKAEVKTEATPPAAAEAEDKPLF